MRRSLLTLVITLVSLLAVALPAHAAAQPRQATPSTPSYLLALGDSLALGYQPDLRLLGHGYAQNLASQLGLQLEDLGCVDETTVTMLGQNGTYCKYWQYTGAMTTTPQITQTMTFLRNNPGQVKLITVDIGVNDLLGMLGQPPVTIQKVLAALSQISTNLDTIYGDLQTATAGQNVPIVTMTYYNPFIVTQPISRVTNLAVTLLNSMIIKKAAAHNILVAQVFNDTHFNGLFSVTNPGPAIAAMCQATWICYTAHPDIHATTQGYTDITQDFTAVLPPGLRSS